MGMGRYQAWHKDALGLSILPAHVFFKEENHSILILAAR